jgi:uncharacterized membrane protein YhiD involved in acid resistance
MTKIIQGLGSFLKVLPYLLAIVLVLVLISNFKSCTNSFGFTESKDSLKAKITQRDDANKKLEDANKENVKAVETIQKSSDVSVSTIDKNLTSKQKITEAAEKQEIAVKQKLNTVIKSFEESPKTLEDMRKKDADMSTIQIASLWDAYCSGTSSDSQCVKK